MADKKAFDKAYKSYQQALENHNKIDALEYAKIAYDLGKRVYGPDHANTAALTLNYGRLIQRKEDARPILQNAVKLYEKLYGKDGPEMIDPLMGLATVSTEYGTLSNARRHYERALKLAKIHFQDTPYKEGLLKLEVGKIVLEEAHSRQALKYLQEARAKFADQTDELSISKKAEADFYIGKYQLTMRKFQDATESLLASLDVNEKYAPNNQITMITHAFLIRAYEERGLRDEATKHCHAIGKAQPINADQDFLPVYRTHPDYPKIDLQYSRDGYAIVELTVDEDGFVKDPKVVEHYGSTRFGRASIKAAKEFRYIPRFEDGEAVATDGVRYRFSFNVK